MRLEDLLLLLLTPFVLTFLAALAGKYPYGGSARIAQHLAPSLCLLAGTGAASSGPIVACRHKNSRQLRPGTVRYRV